MKLGVAQRGEQVGPAPLQGRHRAGAVRGDQQGEIGLAAGLSGPKPDSERDLADTLLDDLPVLAAQAEDERADGGFEPGHLAVMLGDDRPDVVEAAGDAAAIAGDDDLLRSRRRLRDPFRSQSEGRPAGHAVHHSQTETDGTAEGALQHMGSTGTSREKVAGGATFVNRRCPLLVAPCGRFAAAASIWERHLLWSGSRRMRP